MNRRIAEPLAIAMLVLGQAVAASPALGRCRKPCKITISTEAKRCRAACTDAATRRACRTACSTNRRDDRAVCRFAPNPAPPGCGQAFTKVTAGDLVTTKAWYWNGAWGDYDDDGYLDLFVGATSVSDANFLYHNDRDGTFTRVDAASIPKIPSNQHGAAWGDYDNDGHLDLIVTAGNPGVFHNALYHNNGDGTFSAITSDPVYTESFPSGFHGPSWADYDDDGLLDLIIVGHDSFSHLFHNSADGSFVRVTGGLLATDPNNGNQGTWVDYDNDGDLDLFVDASGPFTHRLYRNEGGGTFSMVDQLNAPIQSLFAGCWADYDNDGFPDVFMAGAPVNFLYRNNGDGTFTNVPDSAVVQDAAPTDWIFSSCAWGDYDNDGFIDLFVTVGDGFPDPYLGPPRAHNLLYRNNGDGTFTKVTHGRPVTDLTTQCPGATWGDYDNDGFLDLFVSQGAFAPEPQTSLLYHNNGNNNAWLNVKLVGTVSNRSAIGAKVRVNAFYGGASRWQLRAISGGDGESNQQALNAEFGLADATSIDTVRVEWPSGIVQELHDVAPRQFLTITEEAP